MLSLPSIFEVRVFFESRLSICVSKEIETETKSGFLIEKSCIQSLFYYFCQEFANFMAGAQSIF